MKLELETVTNAYQIQRYDTKSVTVNGKTYTSSCLVMPHHLSQWVVTDFASLTEADFATLLTLKPEVVLLGTGAKLRFPDPALLAPLINKNIGVEVMDAPAACRTYNVLMAEERAVVVALLFC